MNITLSICISTFNRSKFITDTLESIVNQLTDQVELVVVDGCSTDDTLVVMQEYLKIHPSVRYFRENINSGVDADYDKAVSYARGQYCWLMTDDDLIADGAIDIVLAKCNGITDLVIVNSLVKNHDFEITFNESLLKLNSDTEYYETQINDFYTQCAGYLSFIGGVVVKRDFWMNRDRKSYYGTVFIHIGVMLQYPPPRRVSVIVKPLITIRYGNAMWRPNTFNIWMFNWPNLIELFTHLPIKVRNSIAPKSIGSILKRLLIFRAQGYYNKSEYNKLVKKFDVKFKLIFWCILLFPTRLANTLLALGIYYFKPESKMLLFDLATSKYSTFISKVIARKLGVI